jgi:hypothetical protein
VSLPPAAIAIVADKIVAMWRKSVASWVARMVDGKKIMAIVAMAGRKIHLHRSPRSTFTP